MAWAAQLMFNLIIDARIEGDVQMVFNLLLTTLYISLNKVLCNPFEAAKVYSTIIS